MLDLCLTVPVDFVLLRTIQWRCKRERIPDFRAEAASKSHELSRRVVRGDFAAIEGPELDLPGLFIERLERLSLHRAFQKAVAALYLGVHALLGVQELLS